MNTSQLNTKPRETLYKRPAVFYDIESLENLFTLTCVHEKTLEHPACVELYYLDDEGLLSDVSRADLIAALIKGCPSADFLDGWTKTENIAAYDLNDPEPAKRLARLFGADATSPDAENHVRRMLDGRIDGIQTMPDDKKRFPYYSILRDTDPGYCVKKHPLIVGYNSFNYDLSMLCALFILGFNKSQDWTAPSARIMRTINDRLFENYRDRMASFIRVDSEMSDSPLHGKACSPAVNMRRNMLLSGRHLDLMRINEKQRKTPLKRLSGLMGFQILESDRLAAGASRLESTAEALEICAYNLSDVLACALLWHQDFYQAQIELKFGLIEKYPEIVYKKGTTPDDLERFSNVRLDRRLADDSSASFAASCLCPNGHLEDIAAVSFDYPEASYALEHGMTQKNMLVEAERFIQRSFKDYPHVIKAYQPVFDFYHDIEGRNFNNSKAYFAAHKNKSGECSRLADIKKPGNLNICYYNADGTPSSGYVTFSTGGIHGAEYNKELYEYSCRQYNHHQSLLQEAKQAFPDPRDLHKAKTYIASDGETYKSSFFLKAGSSGKKAEWREEIGKKPALFKKNPSGWVLDPKWNYTSKGKINHEDFTSYYPNMLRCMKAFYNRDLGYDRYGEIFEEKERFGRLMKDPLLTKAEREHYAVMREGTKLILNSASGAADMLYDNAIRMNNRIISMRIIGQLCTFMIGAAQTLAGATVVSTNTDGLYTVLDEDLNAEILKREAAKVNVAIESEPGFIVSKDANNRLEMDAGASRILSAAGSLAAWRGPSPAKALSHPAVMDYVLARLLALPEVDPAKPFPRRAARIFLNDFIRNQPAQRVLQFMQNIAAASPSKHSYLALCPERDDFTHARPLGHSTRLFYVKDGTPGAAYITRAGAKKITPAAAAKRLKEDLPDRDIRSRAFSMMREAWRDDPAPLTGYDITFWKASGVPDTAVIAENRAFCALTKDEKQALIQSLNLDAYLDMIEENYTKNWQNTLPGV